MNKINLLKVLLNLQKDSNKGISLAELLVALVMSSIVLTAATSGFINLLSANKAVESKNSTATSLARGLNFIQEDVKAAKTVTREAQGTNCVSSAISSTNCLVLTYPASFNTSLNSSCTSTTVEPKVYYGFEDISSGSQIWLKPGVLKRKIFCSDSGGIAVSNNWTVVADGLIKVSPLLPTTSPPPPPTCQSPLGATRYGGTNSNPQPADAPIGGFVFCVETTNNRLVQIFLYGYTGKNATPISVSTVTFARAN